jgi:hypothetical protein
VKRSIHGPHATAPELLLNAVTLSDPLPGESERGPAHKPSKKK